MICKKHKTYQGKRRPDECPDCWKIYFETDTDNKKKKYPEEYSKYIEVNKKVVKLLEPTSERIQSQVPNISNTPRSAELSNKDVISIETPIRLNKYYWSDHLKTSMKLTGYDRLTNTVLFHVDHVMVIPIDEIENYQLYPYSSDFFMITPDTTIGEARTIKVFVNDRNRRIIKSKTDLELGGGETHTWDSESELPIEDGAPQKNILEHSEEPKKTRKKRTKK